MRKITVNSIFLLIVAVICIIMIPSQAKALDLNSPTITKFQASSDEANALVVNWNFEKKDSNYIIELYNSTTGTYNRFASSMTEFTYQNLESSKDYRIAVRACEKEDCTEWSEAKEARTYDGAVNFKDNSAIIDAKLDNKNLTEEEKKSAEDIKEGYTNNNENKTAQEEAIKNGEEADNKEQKVSTTKISLNKKDVMISVGQTETLVTTIEPANTTDSITWSSSNEKVATVKDGIITGITGGNATIKATSGNKTAECSVTVIVPKENTNNANSSNTQSNSSSSSAKVTGTDQGYIAPSSTKTTQSAKTIPITGVKINKTTIELLKGQAYQLAVTLSPSNTTQAVSLRYSSSNTGVATVSNTGKIIAKKSGTAVINITSVANSSVKASCKVIVKEIPIANIKIKLKYEIIGGPDLTLKKGKTHTLSVLFNPTYTTDAKTIKWTSSNTKVATIDKAGKITAKKKGKTTITATTTGAKKAKTDKIKVEVTEKPIKKVTLNKSKISGKWDGNKNSNCDVTLKATISPSDTTDSKTITWSSSNKKVATVNKNGCVVYKGTGTATITAKAGSKKDTCKITLTKKKTTSKSKNKSNKSGYEPF